MSKEDLDKIKSAFPFLEFNIEFNVVQVLDTSREWKSWRHFGWLSDVNIWTYKNMIHQLYSIFPELEKRVPERMMNITMSARDDARAAGEETATLMCAFLRTDVPQLDWYDLAAKFAKWDGWTGETQSDYIRGALRIFMQFQSVQQQQTQVMPKPKQLGGTHMNTETGFVEHTTY